MERSELVVRGDGAAAVVAAGLNAVLARARAGHPAPSAGGEAIDVPIRGQGADLGSLLAELVRDLLAQLDVHGAGLSNVRLDGLLDADDGFVAWGYLEGTEGEGGAVAAIDLDGDPIVETSDGEIVLRFRIEPA